MRSEIRTKEIATRDRVAPGLHPLEKTLAAVVAAHLAFLPWALGTMHAWSQAVSLAFSVVSFVLALLPRARGGGRAVEEGAGSSQLGELVRFPAFWPGLLFLLYVLVQALNPAWRLVQGNGGGWLQAVSSVAWLPSGMDTPFDGFSPWRSLVIYSSAWMSACAIWTGFTHRRALRFLLLVLAVNTLLLALLGLAQRALDATQIFWLWKPPASYFVSSFIYRNHAGAYFNLMLGITSALGAWRFRRQILRYEPSSPAILLLLVATLIAGMVVFSYSRGAILLMSGYLVLAAAVVVRGWLAAGGGRPPLAAAVLSIGVVAALVSALGFLKTDQLRERVGELEREFQSGARNTRVVLAGATLEMAGDRLLLGWGAGSFRHAFPGYQLRHPGIGTAPDSGRPMVFEHAHSDYLEFLAECGIVGCSSLAAAWLFLVVPLVKLGAWRNSVTALLLSGCLVTMIHAAFDFPFFNPAILITWCCLWPLMLRWLQFDRRGPVQGRRETSGR